MEIPRGWHTWEIKGLLRSPKKIVALEGKDEETGEMRRFEVQPSPDNPDEALVPIPNTVPFVRVVCTEELVDELRDGLEDEVPA